MLISIDNIYKIWYTTPMATLQKRKVKGNNYYYIVESKRIKGKPRPIVIKYLGSIESILKHYSISKEPQGNNVLYAGSKPYS